MATSTARQRSALRPTRWRARAELVTRSAVRVADDTRARLTSTVSAIWPPRSGTIEPYVAGSTRLGGKLARPALLGFVGCVAIVLGASQPASPFTSKLVHAWVFGIPGVASTSGPAAPPGPGLFLGVVAVYGGMALLIRAWYDLVRITSRHPGIPVTRLVPVFIAWVAPLLVVAPLFSRDLYSYAAQGEMMSRHINPYAYGTGLLSNGSPFTALADTLWWKVASPYGPLFLVLDGWIVAATGHNVLWSVELLRLLALFGTVLFAIAVPSIARSFGRDGATAFTLAALNPLVLLHLVGGGHNDALMLGLLVAGYALARRGRPVLGIVCCALAAAVKVPAFMGVIYIGWEWLGPRRSPRERLRPLATAVLIAAAVMAACSEVAGIGWGWISGLSNPDAVRSWLDPATAIGLAASKIVGAIGLGSHTNLLLTLARGSGLILAVSISLALLWRADRIGPAQALGWSMLAIVVLSPVVQPWYLSWGLIFLAPFVEGGVRRFFLVVSSVGCFLGLPGGSALVREFEVANPWLVALASVTLLAIAAALVLPRRHSILAVLGRRGIVLAEREPAEVGAGT